jgi:hypothetical protein
MAFRQLETYLYRLHQSRFVRRPEGRLWVLMAIRLLKSSLKRLRPNRYFQCQESRKWFRVANRHLERSPHRLRQSRLLRRAEGRFWVLRELLFKTSQVTSWKSLFSIPEMQQMSSHGTSTPWNGASSTSSKSSFKTYRRQILSAKGHSPI